MTMPSTKLERLYTPLLEAAARLHIRRQTKVLTVANPLERLLAARPYAVIFRQVATPNYEMQRFVAMANAVELTPLVLEYHDDKFVHFNAAKHALLKLRFHSGMGRNGGARIRRLNVADMNGCDGKLLRELRTRSGQEIVDFHHAMMDAAAFSRRVALHDGSPWFRLQGGSAASYYPELFRLFLRHAVLFESFLTSGSDAAFTDNVVLPAFETVCNQHGESPLVCRLDPVESEGDPYWLQYPGELFGTASEMAERVTQASEAPNHFDSLRSTSERSVQKR